jgi:HD-GYP domain-containing protein (c-di-GMP phosphodiesterase class II)
MVADAFDAMTSDRVYRKALRLQDALEELDRNAGTQFDMQVVAALNRLVARGEIRLGTEAAPHETDSLQPGLAGAGLV